MDEERQPLVTSNQHVSINPDSFLTNESKDKNDENQFSLLVDPEISEI